MNIKKQARMAFKGAMERKGNFCSFLDLLTSSLIIQEFQPATPAFFRIPLYFAFQIGQLDDRHNSSFWTNK